MTKSGIKLFSSATAFAAATMVSPKSIGAGGDSRDIELNQTAPPPLQGAASVGAAAPCSNP